MRQITTSTVYAAELGNGPEPVRFLEPHRPWTRADNQRLVPAPTEPRNHQAPPGRAPTHLALHELGIFTGGPRHPERVVAVHATIPEPPEEAAAYVAILNMGLAGYKLEITLCDISRQLLAGTWTQWEKVWPQ